MRFAETVRAARWRITNFIRHARQCIGGEALLEPLGKALETFETHLERILRRWTSTHSNARLEGLNGLFQAAKARARRYRNTATFMTFVYLLPIGIPRLGGAHHGIIRIWPKGRIEERSGAEGDFQGADDEKVELPKLKGPSVLGHALYFSVLSAFYIGWRDLNVGSRIARLQPREYTLRAKGWVRVVSGVQSLISVYFIATWVLTYFGRQFE